jgi:hypothetical protein
MGNAGWSVSLLVVDHFIESRSRLRHAVAARFREALPGRREKVARNDYGSVAAPHISIRAAESTARNVRIL